jgi:hypothetical protein
VPHPDVVDPLLRKAMAPALRDLRTSGIAEPRIEDDDWADDPATASVMFWSPDGSGLGVSVNRAAPEYERVAMLADQVQDWAIEELWGKAPTNWPPCPRHPNNHPMRVSIHDATAVWICPADEVVISPIGELQYSL